MEEIHGTHKQVPFGWALWLAQAIARARPTIPADKLAVEVLLILERHRIDDLVVVDEENRPIGMVDSQDLARHRLI